jgi:hypothetical protein
MCHKTTLFSMRRQSRRPENKVASGISVSKILKSPIPSEKVGTTLQFFRPKFLDADHPFHRKCVWGVA